MHFYHRALRPCPRIRILRPDGGVAICQIERDAKAVVNRPPLMLQHWHLTGGRKGAEIRIIIGLEERL